MRERELSSMDGGKGDQGWWMEKKGVKVDG